MATQAFPLTHMGEQLILAVHVHAAKLAPRVALTKVRRELLLAQDSRDS
jgi:hypothetical protein